MSRSAATSCSGALATKPVVGQLGLGARDLPAQAVALGGALALLLGGVDERARADLDHAARERHGGGRLAVALEVQARHPRHQLGVAVEAVQARGEHLAGLDARLVAPGAQRGHRGDDGADARLGVGVAQAVVGPAGLLGGEQAVGAGDV